LRLRLRCYYENGMDDPITPPYDYDGYMQCRRECNLERVYSLRDLADRLYEYLALPPRSSIFLDTLPPNLIPSNAVDAIAILFEHGATLFPDMTSAELANDITIALTGVGGPLTAYRLHTIDPAPDYPLGAHNLLSLSSGFHSDYYEPTGQVFHFLGLFNTVAQGGDIIFELADIVHECGGYPNTGTIQDARLSTKASHLGDQAKTLSPIQLAGEIRSTLTSPFTGELLQHYSLLCRDLQSP
jgi:hypothetical protein